MAPLRNTSLKTTLNSLWTEKSFRRLYKEGKLKVKAFKESVKFNFFISGQLNRITGKGMSGTFELVDGANKSGAKFEDAIENAVISMVNDK